MKHRRLHFLSAGSLALLAAIYSTRGDLQKLGPVLIEAAPHHHDELTLGYRAPGRVLDYASRLLPIAAPGIQSTSSIRAGRTDPTIRLVQENQLVATALQEATALAGDHALVALVAPEDLVPEITRAARRNSDIGLLERDAMTRPVTVVPAPAAKGLEFDAVVVVEPAAIAGDSGRGLRLLYVAMTRPIQHLSMVHAQPLPAALAIPMVVPPPRYA